MVSVVIPTYNRKAFLSRAIQSVLVQSFPRFELIVVDDGSTDTTPALLAALDDPRVRYLRIAHSGVARARNRGIAAARFEWFSFLDSDDTWHRRKLEAQIDALAREPAFRVAHTDEVWIRRGRRVNPGKRHRKHGGWIYPYCLPLCLISPSSVMVHREVFDRLGVFDEAYPVCEDYELWLRVASSYPVLFLEERLITKVGGHADQLSRSRWGLDQYRVRALQKIVASGLLSPSMERLTVEELRRKAAILRQGFLNRGKPAAAAHYEELCHGLPPVEPGLPEADGRTISPSSSSVLG